MDNRSFEESTFTIYRCYSKDTKRNKTFTFKDLIYKDDTIQTILHKIALNCIDDYRNLTGEYIYAWMEDKQKNIPLGIQYEMNTSMDILKEKTFDDQLIYRDGIKKVDPLLYFYSSVTYADFVQKNNYSDTRTFYFIAVNDFLNLIDASKLSDEQFLKGLINKYYPKLTSLGMIHKPLLKHKKSIQNHYSLEKEKQKIIQTNYLKKEYQLTEYLWKPLTLSFTNQHLPNQINLIKLFKEVELSERIPYSRFYLESYLDIYYKIYKSSIIHEGNHHYSKQGITTQLFEKWIKGNYVENAFSTPIRLDVRNSVSFIVYNEDLSCHVLLIIYVDGKIEIIFTDIDKTFTDELIRTMIDKCNNLLLKINKDYIYSEKNKPLELVDHTLTNRFNIRLIANISKYVVKDLITIIDHFYTELIIIDPSVTNKDILHLYSCKKSDISNHKYIHTFITNLQSKKLQKTDIIRLLIERFRITEKKARDSYDDWYRLFEQKKIKKIKTDPGISILIQQKYDQIYIDIIGCETYPEMNRIRTVIQFIFDIYVYKLETKKDPLLLCKVTKKNKTEKEIYLNAYDDGGEILQIASEEEEEEEEVEEEEEEEEEEKKEEKKVEKKVEEEEEKKVEKKVEKKEEKKVEKKEEEEEEEEEDDDEDSTDESIGKLEDSTDESEQSGGGMRLSQAGGGYNNFRYYINRLNRYDKGLFDFDLATSCGSAQQDKSYARTCQGPNKPDNQPIVMYREDLDNLDDKTGLKNKGKSYKSALHSEGRDPNIVYLCPKYWDVKHEIPLDPKNKKHPITGEDYTKDIMSHDLTTDEMKDTDKYILDRSGRRKGERDAQSTWNRKGDKYDINKYNVTMIPNVHPDGYKLPCCGMTPIFKYLHINESKNHKLELLEINEKDEGIFYRLRIPRDKNDNKAKITKKKKQEIEEGLQSKFEKNDEDHIIEASHVLLNNSPDLNRILYSFPLDRQTKGYVNDTLVNFFHMDEKEPKIVKENQKDDLMIKMRSGLYRVGIQQDNDSFLTCIATLLYDFKDTTQKMINNISRDIDKLDFKTIANGNLIHCFKSESLFLEKKANIYDLIQKEKRFSREFKKISGDLTNEEILNVIQNESQVRINSFFKQFVEFSTKENIKRYLKSDEMKNEKYLIPLFVSISQLKGNKTFKKKKELTKLSIIVFEEKNEQTRIVTPLGGLDIENTSHYLFIYKCENKYEPIYFYDTYGHKQKRFLTKIEENRQIEKIDDKEYDDPPPLIEVFNKDKTGVLKYKVKEVEDEKYSVEGYTLTYKDLKEENVYESDVRIRYHLNEIIHSLEKLCKKHERYNKDEYLTREKVMTFLPGKYKKLKKEYIDSYNKVTHLLYERVIKDKRKTYIIPIKPEKICNDEDIQYLPILNLKKEEMMDYKDALKIFELLDNFNHENGSLWKSYFDGEESLLIDKNKLHYLVLSNQTHIPLKKVEYNKRKHKLKTITHNDLNIFQYDVQYKNELNEYIGEHNKGRNEIYQYMTRCYLFLRRESNHSLLEKIQTLINHPIMLTIHKRIKIFDLLKKTSIYKKERQPNLKQFIEYLLMHPFEIIELVLLKEYVSTDDLRFSKERELIFTQKQILNNEHHYYFLKQSDYIPLYTYYEEKDNLMNRKNIRKRDKNKHIVSFITKYPHQFNRYFGKTIKIYKHHNENNNDFDILSYLFDNEEIQSDHLIQLIGKSIEEEPSIINAYNESLIDNEDPYQDIEDLKEKIALDSYNLCIPDLDILSKQLRAGFCLVTNRYTDEETQFDLHIILDPDLINKDTKMYCLYQDYPKELKTIIYSDTNYNSLGELYKQTQFKKVMNEVYPEITFN